jgi:uncharacterized protein YigE (DUF2233 family)
MRLALAGCLLSLSLSTFASCPVDPDFLCYSVEGRTDRVRMVSKDAADRRFGSLGKVKAQLESRGDAVRFLMNGGMFKPDGSPVGLYVEDGKILVPLERGSGPGNFFMKPNGVFFLTASGAAGIAETGAFARLPLPSFATQSGPMLMQGGRILPAFKKGSANLRIRNGVCIKADSTAVFALSKRQVNFHSLADFFRRAGCTEALYLDGFVSRAFAPGAGWAQLDGDFAVVIAVTARRAAQTPP